MIRRDDPVPPELVTPTTESQLRRLYHVALERGMSHDQSLQYISFRWGARDGNAMMTLTGLVQELTAINEVSLPMPNHQFNEMDTGNQDNCPPTGSSSVENNTSSINPPAIRTPETTRMYPRILPRPDTSQSEVIPLVDFSSYNLNSSPLSFGSPSDVNSPLMHDQTAQWPSQVLMSFSGQIRNEHQ